MANAEAKTKSCQSIIQYTFNDKLLLCQALQTSGNPIIWRNIWTPVPKNTRLAVYGDAAFNKALCHMWFSTELNKGTVG